MIDHQELDRRIDGLYHRFLDAYPSIDDIPWTTMDDREMTLGQMSNRHLNNTLEYFKQQSRMCISFIEMLGDHLTEKPNDPQAVVFDKTIDARLDAAVQHGVIVKLMAAQIERRKASGKDVLRYSQSSRNIGKLTLADRIRKRKAKVTATKGEEDHL